MIPPGQARLASLVLTVVMAGCGYTLRGMKLNAAEQAGCRQRLGEADAPLRTAEIMHPGFLLEIIQVTVATKSSTGGQVACTAYDRLPPYTKKRMHQVGYKEGALIELTVITGPARLKINDIALPGQSIAAGPVGGGPAGGGPAAGTVSMHVKFEGLSAENQKQALAMGYREGDTVVVSMDLATNKVSLQPPPAPEGGGGQTLDPGPAPEPPAVGPAYALARVIDAKEVAMANLPDKLPASLRPPDAAATRTVEVRVELTSPSEGFVTLHSSHFSLAYDLGGKAASSPCVGVRLGGNAWVLATAGDAAPSVNLRLAPETTFLCFAPKGVKAAQLVFGPSGAAPTSLAVALP